MRILEKIADIGIIPVIKLERPDEDAYPLAKALIDGGISVAEITFRAEGADRGIRMMRKNFPEIVVGAGTVLTKTQIDQAVRAGAQFIVSPGFNRENVKYCQTLKIPVVPGCVTPTELEMALACGVHTVKFFPAEQAGGLERIKALSSPFYNVDFIPTGGVNLNNLESYIMHPNVAACGGSFMVTSELLQQKNWPEITNRCKAAQNIIAHAREKRNAAMNVT